MAIKTASTAQAAETQIETTTDGPLMDGIGASVKKMVQRGRERGYVTYDEINAALPSEKVSSEQIEDTLAMLSELGINVIETEETEETEGDSEAEPVAEEPEARAVAAIDEEDLGRTDDPVRMYLREMGSVELLSREGEIVIAKRIEAGREKMIGAICESPLTIRALLEWRDSLLGGRMLLRDIIDLDATYGGGPEGAGPDGSGDGADEDEAQAQAGDSGGDSGDGKVPETKGAEGGAGEDDEEDTAISLAVMEATLLPSVLETFDDIAKTYKSLHKLQEQRLAAARAGEDLGRSRERRYEKLKHELVELMERVHLNNSRIEQLVEQLYERNRKLVGFEGRLLRLALAAGVKREDFLRHYFGREVDPNWVEDAHQLPGKAWKKFTTVRNSKEVSDLREQIALIADSVALEISEFRRIVNTVQEGERVKAGEPLMDGPRNPHDILAVLGEKELQKYLVDEIQEVYRLQGVKINDKHIETIVRQMMRWVKVEDPGDTEFLLDEQVDKFRFREENDRITKEGGKAATGRPLLLGITKASLSTDSFISAASFQETTRVLTEASIKGAVDHLRGLKENVIVGRLIPAGTGYAYHEQRRKRRAEAPVDAAAQAASEAEALFTAADDSIAAEIPAAAQPVEQAQE